MVPAVLDFPALDVEAILTSLWGLVDRARAGKLRIREQTQATFTLSSLGMIDVSSYTAIITRPQAPILATARTEPRAGIRDGPVFVRDVLTATFSSDRHAVDGPGTAGFLGALKARIQEPDSSLPAADAA